MKAPTDPACVPHTDYRSSHLDEGEDYHAKFRSHPYRAVMWEIERETLLGLAREWREPGTISLLDFACGTGRVLETLTPEVGTATGVDVSESMLEVARRVAPGAEILCCDITRSQALDARRFELVTAFRFFPNAEPALREEVMARLAQLLADNGRLVINNHLRRGSLKHRLRRALAAIGMAKRRDLHSMADAEVLQLAARHGLELERRFTAGVLPVLKERRPLLPLSLLRRIERRAAGVAWLAPLCSHCIYVLRRAGRGNTAAISR